MSGPRLFRPAGPECPACGCEDTRKVNERNCWSSRPGGQTQQHRYLCRACGCLWWLRPRDEEPKTAREQLQSRPDEEIKVRPVQVDGMRMVTPCVYCNSRNTVVHTTRPNEVRYHRCRDCRRQYKSVGGVARRPD